MRGLVNNATGLLGVEQHEEMADSILPSHVLHRFHMAMTAIWLLMCVAGTITNAITLRTFVKIGLEDSVTISFYSLALSDFHICAIAFLEMCSFVTHLVDRELRLWFYTPPFLVTYFLALTRRLFNTTSIFITTFLAIQRCLCVALPFHVKGMFTKNRTGLFIFLFFTISVTAVALYASRIQITQVSNPYLNASQLAHYVLPGSGPYLLILEVILGIAFNVTCQVLVLACVIVMGVALKKAYKFKTVATASAGSTDKETKTQAKPKVKETQAMVQVTLVSLIFILTNFPYMVYGITSLVLPGMGFGVNAKFRNLAQFVHNIMFTTELLNSSVNFIVYYKYNSKFRNCLRNSNTAVK